MSNLKFKAIRDEGVLAKERVVLSAVLSEDIGAYLLLQVELFDSNTPSNIVKHSFWFPDKKVKTGDLVVLYTKKGDDSTKKNSNGSTTHFFYWDLPTPIWSNKQSAIVIFRALDWEYEVLVGTDDVDEEVLS